MYLTCVAPSFAHSSSTAAEPLSISSARISSLRVTSFSMALLLPMFSEARMIPTPAQMSRQAATISAAFFPADMGLRCFGALGALTAVCFTGFCKMASASSAGSPTSATASNSVMPSSTRSSIISR